MANTPIVYDPLSQKIDLKTFFRYLHRTNAPRQYGLLYGLILIGIAMIIGVLITSAVAQSLLSVMLCVLVGGGIVALAAWGLVNQICNSIRLERFAAANGLEFSVSSFAQEQGTIFRLGSQRRRESTISGQRNGYGFWFGNYMYTTGSGKHTQHHRVYVVNVTLPRSLPHVIIDGRQNNLHTASGFQRSQRLQLEGDFNTYFDVYCPAGYERDVLYFLTPELMQLLVEMDDKFDIEVLDHELYFYTRTYIKPRKEQLAPIFNVIDTVATEVAENTQRYQDWRVEKKLDQVAPQGARLKQSIWPLIITLAIFGVYIVLRIIAA